MADNTTLPGTGDVIATDDISGTKHQLVKVEFGAADSATQVSTAANAQLPVKQAGATAGVTQVSSSASSVTLQASNTDRRFLAIQNDSTAVLYVKFGTTASTTSYTVQIPAYGYYETPSNVYTGRIDGIWASANGYAYVTEVTA